MKAVLLHHSSQSGIDFKAPGGKRDRREDNMKFLIQHDVRGNKMKDTDKKNKNTDILSPYKVDTTDVITEQN